MKKVKILYQVSNKIIVSIEKIVGLKIDEIKKLTVLEELEYIEQKNKQKLTFSNRKRSSIYGRGNPLLARKKYNTIQSVDKKILKIKIKKYR